MPLKLSVLASGQLLLDGRPVGLRELEEALRAAKNENRTVCYYRDSATRAAPPIAVAVLQLVIKHKLPIRISTKPDSSDYPDGKGVSRPRAITKDLRMPDVATPADIEEVFANIRAVAAGKKGPRGLVIVRPDRTYLLLRPIPETLELRKMAAGLERLIPSDVKRNIAVISQTGFGTAGAVPSLAETNESIPFLGLLMALTGKGHAVWIFEGHPSALRAGCRDADGLIVDSAMRPVLQDNWQDAAGAAMRRVNILVHDRASFQLRALPKLGNTNDCLEFSDQPLRA
jgi:hypothetical protein